MVTLEPQVMVKVYLDFCPVAASTGSSTCAEVAEGAPDLGSPPREASGQAYPLYEELYIVSAWPIVRMVCAAETSFACFCSLIICGTASAIRISMMDMTMSSSMRVKPSSLLSEEEADSSASLRNDKHWEMRSVVFMFPLQR